MEPSDTTWGLREVASLLGVPPAQVRSLARAGVVTPARGPRGELRFAFGDLAFLRRVRDLPEGPVTPRRLRRALGRLQAALPPGQKLHELGLANAAGELVVREGRQQWSPESGQLVFDFRLGERTSVVTLASRRAEPSERDAAGWYRLGGELERVDPERAREAYTRAVALDPAHADAHVNLGCLEHEAGRLEEAEAHYRRALDVRPGDVTARFDLAVVLEDRGHPEAAHEAYRACLVHDPACAEAHYNLARLCERAGDDEGLVRHLVAYRRLIRDD